MCLSTIFIFSWKQFIKQKKINKNISGIYIYNSGYCNIMSSHKDLVEKASRHAHSLQVEEIHGNIISKLQTNI